MKPNPMLKKLGFADDDRVAIIHADDVGMCQASLLAFADLIDFGLVSSGAVMVPCSWFPATAAYCRDHPQADVGVHLTLTSEWDGYRWGPISTRDAASGLMDEEGYLHRGTEAVQKEADPAAVQREIGAQVARAMESGIDATHADTHMGAVAHPQFVPVYLQLAQQHQLPALMLRLDEEGWRELGLGVEFAPFAAQMVLQLEEQGVPMLDRAVQMPLDQHEDRVEVAKQAFDALQPGLTHFVLHPAKDTPELRAITPDWRSRAADYEAFTSTELRDHVRRAGIHVIGYREIRDMIRGR